MQSSVWTVGDQTWYTRDPFQSLPRTLLFSWASSLYITYSAFKAQIRGSIFLSLLDLGQVWIQDMQFILHFFPVWLITLFFLSQLYWNRAWQNTQPAAALLISSVLPCALNCWVGCWLPQGDTPCLAAILGLCCPRHLRAASPAVLPGLHVKLGLASGP